MSQFHDKFITAGFDGAREAAHLLKQHLEQYFREIILNFQPHWKIMVHVYAHLHGLAIAYKDANIIAEPASARTFFSGFNRELPFFEYIDAGNDKEAADSKIKGMDCRSMCSTCTQLADLRRLFAALL